MGNPSHSEQTVADGNHIITRWEYVDNTARDAASYAPADIGGIAQVGAAAPFAFYVLINDVGPTWLTVGGTGGDVGGVVTFGDYQVGTTTTTRYLHPLGVDNGLAHTIELQQIAPRAGTLRNLYVLAQALGTGVANIIYTVSVNGTPSSLTVSIANASVLEASDLVNTVAVSAGDKVSIEVTKSGSVTASHTHITASMELAA
jgi:hypothetical protein